MHLGTVSIPIPSLVIMLCNLTDMFGMLRQGCQQTCTTSGLKLMALGFRDNSLYLMSYGGVLFLVNPGVIKGLHSSCYITPPKSSKLDNFDVSMVYHLNG